MFLGMIPKLLILCHFDWLIFFFFLIDVNVKAILLRKENIGKKYEIEFV